MAVSQWFFGVLIRKSDVESRYPGGVDQFVADVPNDTLLDDGELVGVSFMDGGDLGRYMDVLNEKAGLQLNVEGTPGDCAQTWTSSVFSAPEWIEKIYVHHPALDKSWRAWKLRGGRSQIFAYMFPEGPNTAPLVETTPDDESKEIYI